MFLVLHLGKVGAASWLNFITGLDYPDVSAAMNLSPQRRPREGGYPYKFLFQQEKWIPAFERVKKSGVRGKFWCHGPA